MLGTNQYQTKWGPMNLWPKDSVCKSIIDGNFWDVHLKPTLDSIIEGSVVIDVGANVGFMSLYLASRGCIVHAFEASEVIYEVLCSNIELNTYGGKIFPHNVALYDCEQSMRFYKEAFGDWHAVTLLENGRPDYTTWHHIGGFALVKGEGVTPETTYHTKTLDSFGFENIALIKIDAQGCDLAILKGARNTIDKSHPKIIFEFEGPLAPIHGYSFVDYENYMNELGYGITCLTKDLPFSDHLGEYR